MSHLTEFGRARGMNVLVPRMFVGGVVATFIIATIWQVAMERHDVARSAAEMNVAGIVGPPCPSVSAAAFQSAMKAQGLELKYVFDFNGATFGRAIGYGDCGTAEGRGLSTYDVCEFTSPGVLYVKTAKGESYFLPGIGQRATVMTPDGQARCVMAAPKLS